MLSLQVKKLREENPYGNFPLPPRRRHSEDPFAG